MTNRIDAYSRRSFVTAALTLLSAARAAAEEPSVEIPSYNKMTGQQEISLGREIAQGIEKEKNLKFVETRAVRNYVDEVFQKIVKTSRRPHLPYSIKIVDTKEINAFALPGGFVYLNRGLMEWARSESEMVATLSHEVGHVAGHHGANVASRDSTVDSFLTEASEVLFGDDLPAHLLKQAGGPVAFLAIMKYSRTQELEADLLGFYNMQRAGWDPEGMIQLFHHFQRTGSTAHHHFDSPRFIRTRKPDCRRNDGAPALAGIGVRQRSFQSRAGRSAEAAAARSPGEALRQSSVP
jgi:predicted Zn-dependent protease